MGGELKEGIETRFARTEANRNLREDPLQNGNGERLDRRLERGKGERELVTDADMLDVPK